MSMTRPVMRLARRIAYWLQFTRRQDELREELDFHRQLVAAELDRSARDATVRRMMGNETKTREEARDVWLAPGIDSLLGDCRHAVRALLRSPAFTAVAVATLAVGIGANTAMFSVVHHLLLAPLPFQDGNRIVRLASQSASDPNEPFDLPGQVLIRLEPRSRALEDFAAAGFVRANLGDTAAHDVVPGGRITPSMLHTLRVTPIIGRGFTDGDARSAQPVAMIGYGLWESRFAGSPDALGRTIRVNGESRTIVGVTPRDLTIPMLVEEPPQIWLPLDLDADVTAGFIGYARLRQGATTAAALRELQTVMAERPDPHWPKSIGASVARAVDRVEPRFKRAVVIMFAAVSGLLLIACANIANLLFMRGWTRHRELAIRRALGGGRLRVARLLLIESFVLAILGGALGLLIAWRGLSVILAIVPGGNSMVGGPELTGVGISRGVLVWTAATTIVTSLLFGVGPALFSTREATTEALRTGIRGITGSAGARRLRSGIVVGQIALSLVFLVAAALLVKSFVMLTRVDVGFDARGLAIATIELLDQPEIRDRAAVEGAIGRALESVPGVTGAAFGGPILMTDIRGGPFVVDGPNGTETLDLDMCEMPFVSRDYFRVTGIPLLRGRTFENDDDVVINRKLAARFWPNGNALGARLRIGNGAKAKWMTVVGIAGDVTMPGVIELFTMQMYRPTSAANNFVNLVSFRAGRSSQLPDAEIKRAIENASVSAKLVSIRGVESVLETRVLARPRFALALFGIFASIALLLTAVGLYAVVAYSVTQRTREIGVRVALGADSMAVARMVLGDAIRHAAGGTAVGLIVALATAHLLTSFVYDHKTLDLRAFVGAASVLIVVTLVASSLPLARALAIEPVDALRSD
jgi:putative ABC transport system permease protein